MADSENLDSILLAIHSRLGVIEGRVNLVARAERAQLLEIIGAAVRNQPVIGQLYLLLDGVRTQKDLRVALDSFGIPSSKSTVSRRIEEMEKEMGIADVVEITNATVHRRDPTMEKILNLSANVRKWLAEEGHVVPDEPARRRSKPT